MKRKVVLKINHTDLIAINDTTDVGRIYAFQSNIDDHVVLIRNSDSGYYTNWLFADKIQEECYGPYNKLHEILKKIFEDGYSIFEFDNELDFIEWIRDIH